MTSASHLGITHLAVLADETGQISFVPNPKHFDAALGLLRRLSRRVSRRRGPDRRTGRTPSRRWVKDDAQRNRVHHRVANLRADAPTATGSTASATTWTSS
ncbi:transposase [Catellatospora citrea]|uniref:transposase n=1 Tax=Catellatospora citrea TaxID=53366 RepID=UPI00340AAFB8